MFDKYANSWGHVIITIFFGLLGAILVLFAADAAAKGIGIALITTSSGAWFIPGAAKQFANEMSDGVTKAINGQGPQGPLNSNDDTVKQPIVQ